MANPSNYAQHPAEEGFSRTGEMIKYVAGKALKWAAYGALIAGFLYAVPALMGFSLSSMLGGFGAKFITAHVFKGLAIAAAVTGTLGAIKGIAGASEAADEKLQDRIADWEQNEISERSRVAMQRQGGVPIQASGLAPNIGFGPGRGQGVGVGG